MRRWIRTFSKEIEFMTVIVKSSDENTIALPERLLRELNLSDGDEVKAVLDGQTLQLTRLDRFLSLKGALADDEAFDEAMQLLSQAWESWTPLNSA
jgi:antitoxin component of MazEF toxin-antitoxin module